MEEYWEWLMKQHVGINSPSADLSLSLVKKLQRRKAATAAMMTCIEDTKRQRLRHWLPEQIDSRKFPGLEWVDEHKRIFRVPWRHGSRHGWKLEKDAAIFCEWAIHTGKYQPGQKADPRKWKTNFRCALNALPDINELKEQSNPRGKNAFKVYQITPGRKNPPAKGPKRTSMHSRFPPEDNKYSQANYMHMESKVVHSSGHGVEHNILDIVIDMMDEYGSSNSGSVSSPDSVGDPGPFFSRTEHTGYYHYNPMLQAHM